MSKVAHKLAVHFSSAKQDWATPQVLFDELNSKYGPFDLDVCATYENTKVANCYIDPKFEDGLAVPWANTYAFPIQPKCWMNPPYGREIGKWIKKAYEESQKGCLVVALLPARTDTRWFHDYCYDRSNVEVRFLRGRVRFVGATASAPFPSMIVVFNPSEKP